MTSSLCPCQASSYKASCAPPAVLLWQAMQNTTTRAHMLEAGQGFSCLGGRCYLLRRIIVILFRHLSSIIPHSSRLSTHLSCL